ncbi:MAG: hypothetical protein R3B90_15360 [Planctomycetaceae bacterium]
MNWSRLFTTSLLLSTLLAVGAAVWLWVLPVEVFQQRAIERAGADPYARLEAVGSTEAMVWLGRGLLPAVALLITWGLLRSRSCSAGWPGRPRSG